MTLQFATQKCSGSYLLKNGQKPLNDESHNMLLRDPSAVASVIALLEASDCVPVDISLEH